MILRCGDTATVEFARERIGTRFDERTGSGEKATLSNGRQKTVRREIHQVEEFPFSRGDLTAGEPGGGHRRPVGLLDSRARPVDRLTPSGPTAVSLLFVFTFPMLFDE